MAGWYYQCNGYELGQTQGDGEGQRGLACRSPWGCKESDTTEQLNKTNKKDEQQDELIENCELKWPINCDFEIRLKER